MSLVSASDVNGKNIPYMMYAGAASLLLFCLIILGYTGRDDSHITYFVADHIANGLGLINYNGTAVEQSSSLSLTFILAFISYVTTLPAAVIGPFVSLFFHLITIFVVQHIFAEFKVSRIIGVVTLFIPSPLYWALSGMENSLYSFLLILLVFLMWRVITAPNSRMAILMITCSSLVTVTRPEAIFILISSGIITVLLNSTFQTVKTSALIVLSSGFTLLLRLSFGLNVFPNTVSAKQNIYLSDRIEDGVNYVFNTANLLPISSSIFIIFLCLSGIMLFNNRKNLSFQPIVLSFSISIVFFAILSGGDWMEAGRFLSPLFWFASIGIFLTLPKDLHKYFAVILILSSLAELGNVAKQRFGGIPLYTRYDYQPQNFVPERPEYQNVIHARDISFIDKFLSVLAKDPRDHIAIASGQAGMIPYYLIKHSGKKIDFIDLTGLTTTQVKKCDRKWGEDFYQDFPALRNCIGVKIDYVYDLDTQDWYRLQLLEKLGCRQVFRDEFSLKPVSWKAEYRSRQFLAACN